MSDSPTAAVDVRELCASWLRDLRASCSPLTLKTYRESVETLAVYLAALDVPPPTIEDVTREHVRGWLLALKETGKADSTIGTRFRNVRSFFNWLVREDEIEASPTANVSEPKVIMQPVAVVPKGALLQMLETCDRSFDGRRDEALIRCYADGGMRLAECATLTLDDVDMDQQVFWVKGKGGKIRAVPFGTKTSAALDRYLRARRRHPKAAEYPDRLWLGRSGALTPDGVYQIIKRRSEAAGLDLHPHQLRHTAAHQLRMAGMNDQDMKRIFGWGKNSRMIDRYGESAADERAREAHRRLSFGDQL